MSVDQLPPGRSRRTKRDAQLVRYDEYIEKQIQSTRRLVKLVDILTALLGITTGALAFLLLAAVADHWLVPGGFSITARALLFAVLVGSVGYYAVRRLWPLCVGSINPAYAAQTIERDNPSLKNSLLNLLLFRQHREGITDAVYETLEEQAAQRLTRVPVESAVDRTQLLRLGYALVFIVAAAALYKILSPKDPLVTAERVLMPWADVVPASRVSIENVEPGATTLARGEVLTVSADVRGIGEDDPVVVRYTTADGQAVDMPAPMKPSAAGLRFTGQIPPAQEGMLPGVAQDFRYRIEAGDARSREFAVSVVAAPTITVERIDYDYPDYTLFADHSVERLGDIRAIEGTKVTIHARANQPIEEAAIDFEADGRRDIVLNSAGHEAQTTFMLALRDDRQTPKFTSYVLRFTGDDGRPNRDPVKFPIDVRPDLGPEVALVAPAEKVRDVRLDETVAIEVEARDPDFALAEVRLQGEATGRKVIDTPLLANEHTGRYSNRLLFTPSEHDLQPGDVVRYWVTARDNRTPQPNEATSDSQTLRIVSLDPRKPGQPPQDRIAQREQREPQGDKQSQGGNQSQEGEQQPGEGGQSGGESNSSQDSDQQQPGESTSADGRSDQSGQQNSAEQSGEQSSEKSGNDSAEPQSDGDQSGDGQSSAGEQSGESGEQQDQPGGASGAGKSSDASPKDSQQPSDGGQSSGQQNNSNQKSGGKAGKNGSQGQERKDTGDQQGSNQTQRDPGNSGQSKSGDKSPVSPEGDNDGEAFDRIQQFLKREGKLPEQGNEKNSDSKGESKGESASADGEQSDGKQSEAGQRDAKPNSDKNTASNPDNQSTPNADSKGENPGAKASPGDAPEKTNEPADQGNKSESPNGQQTSSKGQSGAGDQKENSKGSPDAQPNMKPADKWQQTPSGEKQESDQEPPSGSHGKRESDSQGDQGGDRAGGGKEGGGQKANREGTGGAGQNQSADEGAGESSEQGAGHNSPNAGQDATANDPTGQSGSQEKGNGSAERDGQGNKPGGSEKQDGSNQQGGGGDQQSQGEPASDFGELSRAAGGDQSKSPNDQSGQAPTEQPNKGSQDSGGQDSGGGAMTGAGRVPNGTMAPAKTEGTAPEADAANLDYARQQTDLVLESLAEQMKRQKVDKRLLDELGWTEVDLKRFLDRWQQLKAAARDDSPSADTAQRELDNALRSLGLQRGQLQQSRVSDDTNRDLRQGYRGAVPLEYQERLRAYNQGVSRARQPDE